MTRFPRQSEAERKAEAAASLKRHTCPEFKAWLVEMLRCGNALGSDLVEALPWPDAPPRAGTLLKAAEALGWIGRGAWAPSTSQSFFDSGRHHAHESARDFHAECWSWSVLSEARQTVAAYAGPVAKSTIEIGNRVKYSAGMLVSLGRSEAKRRGTVTGFTRIGVDMFPIVCWNDGHSSPIALAGIRKA